MDILDEFINDDLYMRYAVDEAPDDGNFTMHIHERYEIFYFISGNARYLVEGSEYVLEQGSILIMRPLESHRVKILGAERYERYAINFSLIVLDSIDPQHRLLRAYHDRPLGRGNMYYPSEIFNENIRGLFAEVFETADEYDKRSRILSLLFLLLNRIDKAFFNRGTGNYPPPQSMEEKVVSYVNAHLFETISVSSLAKHFFLSESQFGRIFKRATGTPPWEYITIKRLTAAKEKIRSGITVQNACSFCGFGDYSSFYRAYVRYFGIAPKSDRTL